MYAVRINPDSACKPKILAPGEVWVTTKDKCQWYGPENKRLLFRSVKDANEAKCEPWEIVVKVEEEK